MYPPRSSEPESPLASSLLRGVLDTVPAAVVFFDGRGQPLLANRCAREVLGELAGAPIDRWVRSARFLSRDGQPLDPDELPAQATLIDHAARREI